MATTKQRERHSSQPTNTNTRTSLADAKAAQAAHDEKVNPLVKPDIKDDSQQPWAEVPKQRTRRQTAAQKRAAEARAIELRNAHGPDHEEFAENSVLAEYGDQFKDNAGFALFTSAVNATPEQRVENAVNVGANIAESMGAFVVNISAAFLAGDIETEQECAEFAALSGIGRPDDGMVTVSKRAMHLAAQLLVPAEGMSVKRFAAMTGASNGTAGRVCQEVGKKLFPREIEAQRSAEDLDDSDQFDDDGKRIPQEPAQEPAPVDVEKSVSVGYIWPAGMSEKAAKKFATEARNAALDVFKRHGMARPSK